MEVVTRTWDLRPGALARWLPASRSSRKANVVKAMDVEFVAKVVAQSCGSSWRAAWA